MPSPWQGKNRHRLRRELPYQSRQTLISRASADTALTPGVAALILTSFAPAIATPRNVVPGTASLVLTGFALTVATPRLVTPGRLALVLTTFAPIVAVPRRVVPGRIALVLNGQAPLVTITAPLPVISPYDWVFSPLFSPGATGGGRPINVFRDTERFPGLPWKPQEYTDLPAEPLPEQVPLAEPVWVQLADANRAAFIALFESGALSEDEFVALLAV